VPKYRVGENVRLILFLVLLVSARAALSEPDSKPDNGVDLGILNIKAYPATAVILLNDHKVGVGSVTVDNLRQGYYKVTCLNKTKSTAKIVYVYAGVTQDVYLSADIPEVSASFGFTSVFGSQWKAFGPSLEAGVKIEHHYLGIRYCWSIDSFFSRNTSTAPYTYLDYWNNYNQPDTISGLLETNNKYSESFYGVCLVYLLKDYFSAGPVEFDPGLVFGFIRRSDASDPTYRFMDSTGIWRDFSSRAPKRKEVKSNDYYLGPIARCYVNVWKFSLGLEYVYLLGNSNGQSAGTFLKFHF
jgi:hypothetical protein